MTKLRVAAALDAAHSSAFLEVFELEPTASGALDGLSFAVKDLIDITGHKTGCGNPTWRDTHPAAVANAVCVDQLLAAGARMVGKTVTDELAFSMLGENHHYGTPLNPRAPQRVPGGSSSGSASAVACGLADFALGTDTGGSVRVPASNCGIWGWRASHGAVSVAGVNPLAPSFDAVGVLARNADVLKRAASVLLSCEVPAISGPARILLLREAFASADAEIRAALAPSVEALRSMFGERVREISLREIVRDSDGSELHHWYETFRSLQLAEIGSSLGSWIAASRPVFGPAIAASFELVKNLDRRGLSQTLQRREKFSRRLQEFLGPDDLLCMPTSAELAPLKGSPIRRDAETGYYPRALSLTAVAGLGRLPQVSLPLGDVGGIPTG
ncbi:MAG: amidase, partial [Burkholderiales bacterium]